MSDAAAELDTTAEAIMAPSSLNPCAVPPLSRRPSCDDYDLGWCEIAPGLQAATEYRPLLHQNAMPALSKMMTPSWVRFANLQPEVVSSAVRRQQPKRSNPTVGSLAILGNIS
jgi:hypothetical protein